MTATDLPTTPVRTDPREVVEAFLAAMAAGDADAAEALIDEDILYVNVSLPPMRGASEVRKVLRALDKPWAGFGVCVHAIAAEGPVVLTERTDILELGPVHAQFWVWGRFEVVDGRITLWRDSFDYVDLLRGTARGIAAAVFPSLRPAAPTPDAAPGRPPRR